MSVAVSQVRNFLCICWRRYIKGNITGSAVGLAYGSLKSVPGRPMRAGEAMHRWRCIVIACHKQSSHVREMSCFTSSKSLVGLPKALFVAFWCIVVFIFKASYRGMPRRLINHYAVRPTSFAKEQYTRTSIRPLELHLDRWPTSLSGRRWASVRSAGCVGSLCSVLFDHIFHPGLGLIPVLRV